MKSTSVAALLSLVTCVTLPSLALAADTYADWGALSASETQGEDFQILTQTVPGSNVLITAIHGGGIEAGTSELAKAVAGSNHSYYLFEGIKSSGNSVLHITATNFDEPTAIKMAAQSTRLISLHGAANDSSGDPIVWMGGLDTTLRDLIRTQLSNAGFDARIALPGSGLEGTAQGNIANRNRILAGVQLEMTRNLRDSFFVDGDRRKPTTQVFENFKNAIRTAITAHVVDLNDRAFGIDPLATSYLSGGVRFYVQPAISTLTLNLGTSIYDNNYSGITLEFYNTSGMLVTTRSYTSAANSRFVSLPLSFLSTGYYSIRVVRNNNPSPSWIFGSVNNITAIQ
ncbi:poly-gamma-glutamate hydrolase family protein [Archangium minus]